MGVDFDRNIVIAIDFDGTITKKDNYPDVYYEYNPIAIRWIKKIRSLDVILILWTCNNDAKIKKLLNELAEYGIHFDYINDYGSIRGNARKVNADIYIDDRSNDGRIRWHKIFNRIKRLKKVRMNGKD